MSESQFSTGDKRLDEILAEYLRAIEDGTAIGDEQLIVQYPEFADQLRAFLADKQQIDDLAKVEKDKTPGDALAATMPPSPKGFSVSAGDSATNELLVGESIRYFGDYELLEEIARGGMGVVYKARQVSLNRIVAIKTILAGQLASEDDIRRFHTEAEAAANLDHPGIVPIYEVGEHKGQHYYSMGYVAGESLAERLSQGPLPPKQAAELVRRIAESVSYAHDRGVIHRDLKPGNVLLSSSPFSKAGSAEFRESTSGRSSFLQSAVSSLQPKITDFGLAKKIEVNSSLTGTGQILGTPSYMAPEQVKGDSAKLGPSTDVYALGGILYCALTGHPPFNAATPMETMMQTLHAEPISPSKINPTVPKDLDTICLKCLQKARHGRYSAAQDLADELGRMLGGQPILARPISRPARAIRWCHRNPVVATFLTTSALLLIAIAVLSTNAYFRESQLRGQAEASREQSLDALARSLYEQARTTRMSAEAGRRWAALELLKEAESLRAREQSLALRSTGSVGENAATSELPLRSELRTEAIAAFLLNDARVRRKIMVDQVPAVNADGTRAAHRWVEEKSAEEIKIELKASQRADGEFVISRMTGGAIVDLDSGREIDRWLAEPEHMPWHMAISADGEKIASTTIGSSKIQLRSEGGEFTELTWPGIDKSIRFLTVERLKFGPDGSYLAGALRNRRTRESEFALWNLNNGQSRALESSDKELRTNWLSFTSDGKMLAYPVQDNKFILWNLETATQSDEFEFPFPWIAEVVFNPTDEQVSFLTNETGTGSGTVIIWDLKRDAESFRIRLTAGAIGDRTITFSSDGKFLAVCDVDAIRVWSVDKKKEVYRLDPSARAGSVYWPSQDRFLTWSNSDRFISFWEFSDRSVLSSIAPLSRFVFSPDGRWLAGSRKHEFIVIDRTTGAERSLRFLGSQFLPPFFSADSQKLAAVDVDRTLVWDVATGEQIQSVEDPEQPVRSAAFTSDGELVLAKDFAEGDLALLKTGVWATGNNQQIWSGVGSATLNASATLLASADKESLTIWSLPKARSQIASRLTFTRHKVAQFDLGDDFYGLVSPALFSPDDRYVAMRYFVRRGRLTTRLAVWDIVRDAKVLDTQGFTQFMAFSPDYPLLAIADAGFSVHVWNLERGEELFRWQPGTKYSEVTFAPEGTLAAGSESSLQILDLPKIRKQLAEIGLGW